MRNLLFALCLLGPAAHACETHVELSGTVHVPTCPRESANCRGAAEVVHRAMNAMPDDPAVMAIGLHASPWRLYDGDMRILTVEDVAAKVRASRDPGEQRVDLMGSWTGVAPAPGVPSLAERLSKALDGLPVRGEDGFLWFASDGTRRTTRQAFTTRDGAGAYLVPEGADVLVSLASGWPAYVVDLVADPSAELLMRAAAGYDVFFLCPDKALAGFERAAAKGSAIAAYNAALMRLERNGEGDRAAALALLERGVALGDGPSTVRLERERN
ncbi:hypothetical protein [Lysobacter humi (ex Lee et al. 2017)]